MNNNLKVHYGIYSSSFDIYGENIPDKYLCGTWVTTSNYNVVDDVNYITCEKCIKMKQKQLDEENKPIFNVARDFDDVFEVYVAKNLTYSDAVETKKRLDKTNRHYVSYRITKNK